MTFGVKPAARQLQKRVSRKDAKKAGFVRYAQTATTNGTQIHAEFWDK